MAEFIIDKNDLVLRFTLRDQFYYEARISLQELAEVMRPFLEKYPEKPSK